MPPSLSSLLVLAALLPQDPRGPVSTRKPDGNKLVKVELLAERAALRAGERFALVAKLSVQKGWHIYWGENCGDSGVPTRLELEGPDGFVVSAPRFPVPERREDPGDIVSYVHEGEVLVLFDVEAPAKLDPSAPSEFELDASWLVCIRECYEGAGAAKLALPAAADAAEHRANEALFAAARARQPRPMSELAGLETAFAVDAGKPGECTLTCRTPGAEELGFLPHEQRDPAFVSARFEAGALVLRYRWRAPANGPRTARFAGVLTVKDKGAGAHYALDRKYDVSF